MVRFPATAAFVMLARVTCAYHVRARSRNCITHNCACDYAMKPRKGSKKNHLLAQGSNGRSDSDSTMVGSASSDGGSPSGKLAGKGLVAGSVIVAPSYYVLPPTEARLLHHMSSIAQSIETGRAGDLVIYLKKLPT